MDGIDHEVTFCSDASGWMNEELASRPELPFARARIEQSSRGSRKRRDLTILDRSGSIAITGEVKLPYAPDGASPYNAPVVEDAHSKAARVGAQCSVSGSIPFLVEIPNGSGGSRDLHTTDLQCALQYRT